MRSTANNMIVRRFYGALRDKHVYVLRALIILCSSAAVGLVLFGRDVRVILLAVAVGCACLILSRGWLRS